MRNRAQRQTSGRDEREPRMTSDVRREFTAAWCTWPPLYATCYKRHFGAASADGPSTVGPHT